MITGALVGDRQLILRLKGASGAIHEEVAATVKRLGYDLERQVKDDYLRGPRPTHLGIGKGRLSSSITHGSPESRSRFEDLGATIYYYVGTNVPYGKGWEEGFSRKVGAGARGGPRTLTGQALASYIARHPPGVKHIGARPFLAPGLADMRSRIIDELGKSLTRGMQKALAA